MRPLASDGFGVSARMLVQQHLQVAALLERMISVTAPGGAKNPADALVLDFVSRFFETSAEAETLTPSEISRATGYSRARVTVTLSRLAAHGLVVRKNNERGDRRLALVSLSAKGQRQAASNRARLENLQILLWQHLHPRVRLRSSRLLHTAAILTKEIEALER